MGERQKILSTNDLQKILDQKSADGRNIVISPCQTNGLECWRFDQETGCKEELLFDPVAKAAECPWQKGVVMVIPIVSSLVHN